MSEFGSGIVVPLVKLAAYYEGKMAARVREALAWQAMEPIEREPIIKAVLDGEPNQWAAIVAYTARMDIEAVVHEMISLWAYGASDYMLDLATKRNLPKLQELRSVLLDMRLPIEGVYYTGDDWNRVQQLFIETVLEVDTKLGKVPADWGEV